MKHIIIGGDGFVGRHLAVDLDALKENVVVVDIVKSDHDHYDRVPFIQADIREPDQLAAVPLEPDDVVYNLAAKMLSPIMPRAKRHDFFWPTNCTGVGHIIDWMEKRKATQLIHFTTDMIYGHTQTCPVTEDHPTAPLGEYGLSKLESEVLCQGARERGMRVSIFRPRLIIGPGRLGILSKLFKLIDMNLPVPMIGSGRNAYQFISVYDCASAARLAWAAGIPNEAYNLGSDSPPSVRELLGRLIKEAGSRSILMPTPAVLVKAILTGFDNIDMSLMDPEQFLIADEYCVVDTSKAKRDLGWSARFRDDDMLIAAYREYRSGGKPEVRPTVDTSPASSTHNQQVPPANSPILETSGHDR
jgi:dTDP-glucose 4,6-dehydratase